MLLIKTNARSVLGKYWSSSFFASLWTEPQARSITLQKKNETNIFPVRTEQASSIKFLLLRLYFEFPDGTADFIGDNARATIRREKLFLLRHFRRISAKSLGQTTQKNGFFLTSKCFLLNNFSVIQISEFSSWAVHLSGTHSKIRTAQGTNQSASFHLGPVQPYNNILYPLFYIVTSFSLRVIIC